MESSPNRSTAISAPVSLTDQSPDHAQMTGSGAAVRAGSTASRFVTLWRETVATFIAHPLPILLSAWIGFAAIVVAAQGVQVLTGQGPVTHLWVFLASAAAAVLLLNALAQGAVAWIGLQGGDNNTSPVSLANALNAATAGWRGLLAGTLLHALLPFVCALSFTPILMSSGVLMPDLAPIDPTLINLPRLAFTRSIDAIALGVLHPFQEWVVPTRMGLRPVYLRMAEMDFATQMAYQMKYRTDPLIHVGAQGYVEPMPALPAGLIALAGLLLLAADGILLRFNAVAAIRLAPRNLPALTGTLGPLVESARLGVRHALLVLVTAVTLRVFACVVQILCLVLMTSVVEVTVLPQLAWSTGATWVLPVGRLAAIFASATVSAVLTAFCALYDARLYLALQSGKQGVQASR